MSSFSVSGGIVVDPQELRTSATTMSVAGEQAAGCSWSVLRLAGSPDLLAPALFDPGGALRVEAAMADASAQLLVTAAYAEELGVSLLTAATGYQVADDLQSTPGISALIGAAREIPALFHSADSSYRALATLGVDGVYGVLAPVVCGYLSWALLHDGHPVVSLTDTSRGRSPGSLSELLTELDECPNDGDINVQILDAPPNSQVRQVIVEIPGTDSWNPSAGKEVTDLTTNMLALTGSNCTYERGIIEALRQAGVTRADDITLIGHSQGGMVAVNTAENLDTATEFRISHVITAGSPIGLTVGAMPQKTQVLAIENNTDLVPSLDGTLNPALPNVTTVTINRPHTSVGDSHDLARSYIPGARDIETNTQNDPSVQAYLHGMQQVTASTSCTRYRFHIERAP